IEVGATPYLNGDAPPVVDSARLKTITAAFQDLRNSAQLSNLLADESEDIQDEMLEYVSDALVQENPVRATVHAQVDKNFMGTGTYAPLHARVRLVLTDDGERERHHSF